MFVRVTAAKGHRYVQLVHNYRDPETRVTKTRVLHNFGREDQLDVDALRRLVQSISRFLDPPASPAAQSSECQDMPFRFLGARKLGGVWILDHLWHDLKLDAAAGAGIQLEKSGAMMERWLFAAVAASILVPHGVLPLTDWVRDHSFVPGLVAGEADDGASAIRLLSTQLRGVEHGLHESISRRDEVSANTLFFATVPIKIADDAAPAQSSPTQISNNPGDPPGIGPVTLGLVVTPDALPVRLWVWPGNLAAPQLAEQVRNALSQSGLGQRLVALDTGGGSGGRTRAVHGGGELFVVCERLAGPSGELSGLGGQATPQARRSSLASEIREMVVERGGSRHRARVIYNYPLRGASDELTADQISLGFRQISACAARFGLLRQSLDGYTVGSSFEDRIRMHSLTRWLALLLISAAEQRTELAWEEIQAGLQSLQVGIHQTGGRQIWQTSPLTAMAATMLAAVGAAAPPQCLKVETYGQPD